MNAHLNQLELFHFNKGSFPSELMETVTPEDLVAIPSQELFPMSSFSFALAAHLLNDEALLPMGVEPFPFSSEPFLTSDSPLDMNAGIGLISTTFSFPNGLFSKDLDIPTQDAATILQPPTQVQFEEFLHQPDPEIFSLRLRDFKNAIASFTEEERIRAKHERRRLQNRIASQTLRRKRSQKRF